MNNKNFKKIKNFKNKVERSQVLFSLYYFLT